MREAFWVRLLFLGDKLIHNEDTVGVSKHFDIRKLFWIGMMISALGMGIGVLARRLEIRKAEKEVQA